MFENSDIKNLPTLVNDVIKKEESEFPEWIRNDNKVTRGSSSANEMRGHLRHVVFPHSLHSYQKLHEEFSVINKKENISEKEDRTIKNENSSSNGSSNTDGNNNMMVSISAITSKDNQSKNKLRFFFDNIKNSRQEGTFFYLIFFLNFFFNFFFHSLSVTQCLMNYKRIFV